MKKKSITWIGLSLVMGVVMSIVWMACQEIPNDDHSIALTLNVNLPGAGPAAAGTGMKTLESPLVESAGHIIWPPASNTHHLRINISNPEESFYVYDYVSGTPMSLLVAAGSGRVVDVEAYMIPSGQASPDYISATHFLTGTSVGLRTLDLSGEAVSVTIDLIFDNNSTGIDSGIVTHTYVNGSSVMTLSNSCPDNTAYYANITDLDFGITFPSVPVTLFFGGSLDPKWMIDNLLKSRNYNIHVWHSEAQIYDNVGVTTGATAMLNMVRPLHFVGFNPNPFLVFNPSQISGLSPGSSLRVSVQMYGGWGYIEWASPGMLDTCGGWWDSFYQEWVVNFLPTRTVCMVELWAEDCNFNIAEGTMLMYTTLPGMCDGDTTCEPTLGEDNGNCPACNCGDWECFPPWEDETCGDCAG
jgi:hypothetical protein